MAEACDVPTRWSCRSGVCQTCMTPVLARARTQFGRGSGRGAGRR
ncbi:2Fe-2S iron-sulfur cluster-binding protein [Kibdelosporangium aridum]